MTPWLESSDRSRSHLSADAIEELRALLLAQRRANAEQARAHATTARELAAYTDADSVIERELAEVCEARGREAVQQVEDALERLDAGAFGRCEGCGVPIPLERLRAVPQTRFCVGCPRPRRAMRRQPHLRAVRAARS